MELLREAWTGPPGEFAKLRGLVLEQLMSYPCQGVFHASV